MSRAHQPTDLEWLTSLPADWEATEIGRDVWVRARLGWKGLTADEYVDDGVPMLATPDIKDSEIRYANANKITHERYEESPEIMLQDGDVLLTKDGSTIGTVNVVRDLPGPATVNGSIAVMTPTGDIYGRYLFWFIASSYAQSIFGRLRGGMGVPHLFQRDINRIRMPRPPLREQHAIADYLDRETARIDTLIEEQQRLIEMLRGRRVATIAEALDGHEMTRLRRLVDPDRPMTYGILQCGPLVDGGVVYIGPSDIVGEGRSPERAALRTTAPEIASAYQRSVLAGGDIVVSIGPAYGKVAVVSEDLAGGNLTQDTVRVALRPDLAYTRFVVWALLSRQTADYWDYEIMGATFRRLNLGTLARTPIPLPSLNEQHRIAAYLDEQTAKIDALIAETELFIELARERRSALITAVVTGQIDVREMA